MEQKELMSSDFWIKGPLFYSLADIWPMKHVLVALSIVNFIHETYIKGTSLIADVKLNLQNYLGIPNA